MRSLRVDTLGWGVSLYCLVIGTLMLITPHQFATRTFLPLQPWLPWAGTLLMLAGSLLLATTFLALRRLRTVAYLWAGVCLLTLASVFTTTGAWTGLTSYLALGLSTVVAALLAGRSPAPPERDLFSIAMGAGGLFTGLVILMVPSQFESPTYDIARPFLPLHGATFLLGGLGLLAVWLGWPGRRGAIRLVHALAGGAFLAFCLTFAIPNRGLPAIALYGGLGAYLVLLPYVAPAVRRLNPGQLQTRLALALMGLAALPLLSATAIITAQEERQATELALGRQRALAATLARSTGDYVGLHMSAVQALAAELSGRPASEQAPPIANVARAFPSVQLIATYDRDGGPVSSTMGRPTSFGVGDLPLFARARDAGGPVAEVRTSRTLGLPVLSISAPITGDAGQFDGLVVAAVATSDVGQKLAQAAALNSGEVYVVDEQGRVIAHPNPQLARILDDRSAREPVAALLASGQAGETSYQTAAGAQLAGFAPVTGLGWGVIVDRPAASVLDGVRAGREAALGVLVVVLALAIIASVQISRLLAVPLAGLARATRLLAAGEQAAPLPASELDEVAGLTAAFRALRDDLARRTLERDRAEARLRMLADASGRLAASLDEPTILGEVAATLVPAAADWCGLFLADEGGALTLAAEAPADGEGADARRAALARDLAARSAATSDLAEGPLGRGLPDTPARGNGAGPDAVVAAPMVAEGRAIGALVLARAPGGVPYSHEDHELVTELARRIALALAHTRLFAQEQHARTEAEAAVQIRERFLATAAHELKTPLTPLLGQAELLLRRMRRGTLDPARDQRSVEAIVGQAHRLNRLVTSMLDLERLRSGRIELSLDEVDLGALAAGLVDELEPTLREHRIVVEAPPAPALAVGDELRLEQVLLNLLQNALKYSPDGGLVTVRVLDGEGRVGVQVVDQGVGIPAAELPRLFTPFYRAAGSERSAVPGLGIGLALVKELVTLHRGSVQVASVEGEGSAFTVWVPAARVGAAAGIGRRDPSSNTPLPPLPEADGGPRFP